MESPLRLPNTPSITLRHIIGIFIGVCIVGAILVYLGYQARFLIAGPQIELTEAPALTTSSSTVTFIGSTDNITRLRLNGRQIFTNQDGHFSELAALTPGANIITIEAEDRYGRTAQVKRTIVQTN